MSQYKGRFCVLLVNKLYNENPLAVIIGGGIFVVEIILII